jgi:hypothetical protein
MQAHAHPHHHRHRYMERTGCSLEDAQREVDDYLKDKESYIIRKRAEEARGKKGK